MASLNNSDVVHDLCLCVLNRTLYGLQTGRAVLKTIPVRKGKFQLQVVFCSTQLTDVIGDEEVTVA